MDSFFLGGSGDPWFIPAKPRAANFKPDFPSHDGLGWKRLGLGIRVFRASGLRVGDKGLWGVLSSGGEVQGFGVRFPG